MDKFLYWWKNEFWFQYKTPVILSLIALVFVVSLVRSLIFYPTYDLTITLATNFPSDTFSDSLTNDFNDILKDADGKDGIKTSVTSIPTNNPDKNRLTNIGVSQSVQTCFYIDESTIAFLNEALVAEKKDNYWYEDITSYTDKYAVPEEYLLYGKDGKIYGVDVSSFKYVTDNDMNDSPLYMVLVANLPLSDDEGYFIKRENAAAVLDKILAAEFN